MSRMEKKVLQGRRIIKSAQEFLNEVSTADINIKCNFLNEQGFIPELEEVEKCFKRINELKGMSCHSIKKTSSLSVNMYINTGDDIPFKENINLIDSNETASTFILLNYSVYYDDNWYIGRITNFLRKYIRCVKD